MDPPSHGRALAERLGLPFPVLSDARGDLIRDLGLWNEEEGVSEPAVVVIDGSGTVRHLYSGGRDFSDRPARDDLLAVLDGVGADGAPERAEPRVRLDAGEAEEESVRPEKPPFKPEALVPYYRGAIFAAIAIEKKLNGGEAAGKVEAYRGLLKEYEAAIRENQKRVS